MHLAYILQGGSFIAEQIMFPSPSTVVVWHRQQQFSVSIRAGTVGQKFAGNCNLISKVSGSSVLTVSADRISEPGGQSISCSAPNFGSSMIAPLHTSVFNARAQLAVDFGIGRAELLRGCRVHLN